MVECLSATGRRITWWHISVDVSWCCPLLVSYQCCQQTSVRPFDDGLVEERSDGVDLPQLPHLSAWIEPKSPSLSDSVCSYKLCPDFLSDIYSTYPFFLPSHKCKYSPSCSSGSLRRRNRNTALYHEGRLWSNRDAEIFDRFIIYMPSPDRMEADLKSSWR